MPDSGTSLNSNHERRLSVTCRSIDKLLADMGSTLHSSDSKLAFPHYLSDLSPQQRRVVEDYIRRIRAQHRGIVGILSLRSMSIRIFEYEQERNRANC